MQRVAGIWDAGQSSEDAGWLGLVGSQVREGCLYLYRYVIRPRVRSWGESSTLTVMAVYPGSTGPPSRKTSSLPAGSAVHCSLSVSGAVAITATRSWGRSGP